MEFEFGELIIDEELEFDELELDVIQDTPPLINLEVTPANEEQVFNHEGSYGYDEVKVNAVIGETLNIAPNNEEQKFSGVYTEVNISSIKLQNKVVTPTQEEQVIIADEEFNGLGQVTIRKVEPVATKYKPRYISFYNYGGKELDEEVKNLDISNLESLQNLFYNCANLTSLDFSSWIVPNTITSISYMLYGCRKLEFLDMRTFQLTNITDTSYALSRVPTGCLIIVKDDECKSWFISKFSTYTNVKTVAEYENS